MAEHLWVLLPCRQNFKLRKDEFLYPKGFEDFVFNAISGWYGLQDKEHKLLRRKMRQWTYTQRGGRADVSSI